MSHKGIVRVGSEYMLAWLRLSDGGQILDIKYDPDVGTADFLITHPVMPEGEEVPLFSLFPTYMTNKGVKIV